MKLQRNGAQVDTDGYWKSNAFGVAAPRIGKAMCQREHFPSLGISNISLSFFQSEIYFENSSSMGKHCPGLCLYPAPALIHIRCLINTGNYRVGRSERLIRTSVHCLSPEHCVAAGVLALGCSISGSGLEQLSALIVRLMARHCCCCWAPQPRTQRALPPQGWLTRAISRDALGSVKRQD